MLGGIALRHELIDLGYVGYGTRPSARRRGLATWALGLMLDEARLVGLERVLVICAVDNIASAKTIQRHGGVLKGIRDTELGAARRYWIRIQPTSRPSEDQAPISTRLRIDAWRPCNGHARGQRSATLKTYWEWLTPCAHLLGMAVGPSSVASSTRWAELRLLSRSLHRGGPGSRPMWLHSARSRCGRVPIPAAGTLRRSSRSSCRTAGTSGSDEAQGHHGPLRIDQRVDRWGYAASDLAGGSR